MCVRRARMHAQFEARHRKRKHKGGGGERAKGRDWVVKKKEQMRKKGYDIVPDSKYTGRKRRKVT